MRIFAIDPGTTESAYVIYSNNSIHHPQKDGGYVIERLGWHIEEKGKLDNSVLLFILKTEDTISHYIIEDMQGGKGRVLGRTTIETIKWIGRFQQEIKSTFGIETNFLFRKTVESHILKSLEKPYPFKSPDSNIRHALIARFADKTKGLANDEWQAFALAVCFVEKELGVEL
jgi:hypothetical protein